MPPWRRRWPSPGPSSVRMPSRPGWRWSGLGKCGAQELNYVSDVDVLYVAEPAAGEDGQPADQQRPGHHHRHPAGGGDDPDLLGPHRGRDDLGGRRRAAPGGQVGPAGPHAGQPPGLLPEVGQDLGVPGDAQGPAVAPATSSSGAEFVELLAPLVWTAAERENFVADTQAMRKRVVAHIPARNAGRELKLGEGGLRDVEFSVQLLQLVHGRVDERLRVRATLPALKALVDNGYVGRDDGKQPRRVLPVPARPGAPDPAVQPASHPRPARRRGRPAPARSLAGLRRPGDRAADHLAAHRAGRSPAARAAVLLTAAGCRGPDPDHASCG